MMVEKESGALRNTEFPSVWVDEIGITSTGLRYYVKSAPPLIRPLLLTPSKLLKYHHRSPCSSQT
jgi:hypothetical protein